MTRQNFLEENNIHPSYNEFFSEEKVHFIERIFDKIGNNYTPSKKNIFKVFTYDLNNAKVLLLGMDPYPQRGIATGLSFEVPFDSWQDKRVNASLKNMLKLIYKSYFGGIISVEELRAKISSKSFDILPPDKAFKNWSEQGVLFLNSALTTEIEKPGAHLDLWRPFTRELLKFIGEKKPSLIYLLWGGNAQKFKRYILSGNIIEHNHPAICGKLYKPSDFLNGTSFTETMEQIKWINL